MLEIKNVKKIQIRKSRFNYKSESEYYSCCKNHESESEYSGFGGKDSNPNPNPNIRYNTVLDICYHMGTEIFKIEEEMTEKMMPKVANPP